MSFFCALRSRDKDEEAYPLSPRQTCLHFGQEAGNLGNEAPDVVHRHTVFRVLGDAPLHGWSSKS